MSKKQGNYKVALLGDTSVGKSCLANRFINDSFSTFQEPTIGAAFMTKQLELDNFKVKFEIWDTAGQERYRSLAPMYYRGAMSAIVVFDITQRSSFDGAKNWVREIKTKGHKHCIIALVGNKTDLVNERVVDVKQIYPYVESEDLLYFETSAKTGKNVERMFKVIGENLPKSKEFYSQNIKIDAVKINSNNNNINKTCCF
jgi:Ras-related protein Rab-5C